MQAPPFDPQIRRRIQVRGIVQGVGFRPFVYKLAAVHQLSGFVFNSSSGVTIEIEGSASAAREFVETLEAHPPELAEITGLSVSEMATGGGGGFHIIESREEPGEFALVSPDARTCEAC